MSRSSQQDDMMSSPQNKAGRTRRPRVLTYNVLSKHSGDLTKPMKTNRAQAWKLQRSAQEFLELSRDDLICSLPFQSPLSRRIEPRTIGKLLQRLPQTRKLTTLSDTVVKVVKHRHSQKNISFGDDNEAKLCLRKFQVDEMVRWYKKRDTIARMDGVGKKLKKQAKRYGVQWPKK